MDVQPRIIKQLEYARQAQPRQPRLAGGTASPRPLPAKNEIMDTVYTAAAAAAAAAATAATTTTTTTTTTGHFGTTPYGNQHLG